MNDVPGLLAGESVRTRRRAWVIVLVLVGTVIASLVGIYLSMMAAAGRRIESERVVIARRIADLRALRVLRPAYFEPEEEGNSWEPFARALSAIGALTQAELEAFPRFSEAEDPKIQPEEAEKVLAKLAPHLEELKQAMRRRWTDPDYAYEEHFNMRTPWGNAIRWGKLLSDAAVFRHDSELVEEAADFLVLAWGVGDRMFAKGFLINHLIGIVVESIVLETLRKLVFEHRFDEPQLARLQRALDLAAASWPSLIESLRTEDLLARTAVVDFAARGPKAFGESGVSPGWRDSFSSRFMVATYLRKQDEMMAEVERLSTLPYSARQGPLARLMKELRESSSSLHKVMMPELHRSWRNDSLTAQQLLLARTSLAIARFEKARGALPATLGDLVPVYLPAIPVDEIGKRPLSYVVKGDTAVLYAFGGDNDDDAGRPVPDDEFDEDGDVVWTVKRRVPEQK